MSGDWSLRDAHRRQCRAERRENVARLIAMRLLTSNDDVRMAFADKYLAAEFIERVQWHLDEIQKRTGRVYV